MKNQKVRYDAPAGISYGAVVEDSKMGAHFWKDKPKSPGDTGERLDVRRMIKRVLRPGETIKATDDDTEVLMFGARDSETGTGGNTLERVQALKRVQARVVPSGPR